MKGFAFGHLAANCDSSEQRQARSINLAHVPVRVEKTSSGRRIFFWDRGVPGVEFLTSQGLKPDLGGEMEFR